MLPTDELLAPVSSESSILSGATAPPTGLWKKIVGGITLALAGVFAALWLTVILTPVPIPEHTVALVSSRGFHASGFLFPTIVGAARGEDGSWNTFTISPRWYSLASFRVYYDKRQTKGLVQIESDQSWTNSAPTIRLMHAFQWSGWRFWSETRGELHLAEITGSNEAPIIFHGSASHRLLESSTPLEDGSAIPLTRADISAQGSAFSFVHLLPVCNSLRIPIETAMLSPTSTTIAINKPCTSNESWTLQTTDTAFAQTMQERIAHTFLPKRQVIKLEDSSLAIEKFLGETATSSSEIPVGNHVLQLSEHQVDWTPVRSSSTEPTEELRTPSTTCHLEHPLLGLSGNILHRLLPTVIDASSTNMMVVGSNNGHLAICWTE